MDEVQEETKLLVATIVEDKLRSKVSNIRQIKGLGIVNEIYIVETDTHPIVVRLNSEDSLPQFRKEVWAMQQSERKGVVGPKVLGLGVQESQAFMLQNYIEGSNGTDPKLDGLGIWRTLGEYTQLIHSVNVKGFGDFMKEPGVFRDSWDVFLDYGINSLDENDKLISRNVLTLEQSRKARKLLEGLKGKDFQFGLNHGDISLKNTIVGPNGEVSLLDWGSSEAHITPHFDLIEIIKSSFKLHIGDPNLAAFLEGYGMTNEEFQKILPELKTLLLLRALDKLRWALDRKPELIGPMTDNAKLMIEYSLESSF